MIGFRWRGLRLPGGYRIGAPMTCNGDPTPDIVVMSYHPPWSLTWRWHLVWGPYRPSNDSFWTCRTNGGGAMGFRLPYLGNVTLATQEPMLDSHRLPESRRTFDAR